MSLLEWLASPLLWLVVFCAGLFLCASRLDQVTKRLSVKPPQKDGSPAKTTTLLKNSVFSGVVALVTYYLVFHTARIVALFVVCALCAGSWLQAYRYRVRPLVAAGLPQAKARVFTAMQLLWVGPAAVALALFVRGLYRAP